MAEMIPVVQQTGAQSWSNTFTVTGHTDTLKFRVVGGTFDDSSTEKDIAPTSGSDYTVSVNATVTVDASATQPVLVYYLDGDLWVLVNSASRIFTRPQQKELDYRLLSQGMDAMPLGASLDQTYGGMVLGGGVRIPTPTDMQQSSVVKISDLTAVPFDLTKPVSIVHDRVARTLYYVHTDGDVSNTKIFGAMRDVDIAGYKISYDATGKRSAIIFHKSGRIDLLDEAMMPVGNATQLGYEVTRVVCRRIGVGSNSSNTYVAFDKEGKAHYLRASFSESSVKSDQFYVNASDSYDVLLTIDGKLVGNTVSNAPANVFWYQFVPSSLLALGHDGTNIYQFNIRDNVMNVAPRPLVANDLVVYNTTAAWTHDGGKPVAGMETNGSNALFSFADAESPTQTRAGWPYLELLTPPYSLTDTYDRLFYYAARPTSNLKHLTIRNYQTVWPDLEAVELGPVVTFDVVVDADDPDVPLPITAPAGVTVNATVDGKAVQRVYHGQTVTITLSHEYITSSSFPVSIGRSVYQFEMKTDDVPDEYVWENFLGVQNDTWNRTEDIAITGINVTVPVSVLIDGSEDESRVKVFVDGEETAMPVSIRNGQTLGFEILHQNNTTHIDVRVGQGTSRFNAYTIIEGKLNVGRHWAYVPAGKEVRSDTMRNTGTVPLVLTITETDARFLQGGQTLTLPVGETTSIVFTPAENKQYAIKFRSEQYQYEWNVWADKEWLGDTPATVRSERYVLADSGDIFFGDVPDNFWTYMTVPAGMLLDVDGVRVVQDLDTRGVYKNQNLVIGPFECADTILKIYGLPSHDQPHTLKLGDASLGWLHDMTVDPSYRAYANHAVEQVDVGYDGHGAHAVTPVTINYDGHGAHAVEQVNVSYDGHGAHAVVPVDIGYTLGAREAVTLSPVRPTFVSGATHSPAPANTSVTVITPSRPTSQSLPLPKLINASKDVVTDLRMADLIARSQIKIDSFDSFETVSGQQYAGVPLKLYQFIGTDRNNTVDEFPLFKAVLGQTDSVAVMALFEAMATHTDTVEIIPLLKAVVGDRDAIEVIPLLKAVVGDLSAHELFPLFESVVGNTITADTFWPAFEAAAAVNADSSFSNTFETRLFATPQYFDLLRARYRPSTIKAKPSQIEPEYRPMIGSNPVVGTTIRKLDVVGSYAQPMTQGDYVQLQGAYPQKMSDAQYRAESPAYLIETSRARWHQTSATYRGQALTARYVDPIYHSAILVSKQIPFVGWTPAPARYKLDPARAVRMYPTIWYQIDPADIQFYHLKIVAGAAEPGVAVYSPEAITYRHGMSHKNTAPSPIKDAGSINSQQSRSALPIKTAALKGQQSTPLPIRVTPKKTRTAQNKTYGIKRPVIEAWTVAVNHGNLDKPLNEGYFATELLALQNATQVWGFEPSMVYGIQQPNGYWTWAQITVCQESCGSMSCDARGYLSGG